MSKRARTLILGAALAAMNLAGMTAIAHAKDPSAQRPPTQGQVREPYRYYHDALAAQGQAADAVEQFRQSERASQEQPTAAEAVEEFRRAERASQQQPTSADTRRPPTEAQVGESWGHPGNVGVRSPEPGGQPDWLIPGIGVLAAILTLVVGLVVIATKRTGRRVRAGQAA
jgi:hypothetical protein